MYKILVSGYYGFHNIGDESILQAVVENLNERLDDIEITVLSKDPEKTAEKYGIKAVDRKSFKDILKAIKNCDMLISGGGSLLQDVTSKRSILYYLAIIKLAQMCGKKTFIYSQGIGPINSEFNRKLTRKILDKTDGIVVRDENSKEFLKGIGILGSKIVVTADPVLRIKPSNLEYGKQILENEGIKLKENSLNIGMAIREKNLDSDFIGELILSIEKLYENLDANIILIPFHFAEDIRVIQRIKERVKCPVYSLENKYLTSEMLSIIGNMNLLVGVRLHALIHAVIMRVPLVGISYDPKINSFLKSIDTKAFSTVYDFRHKEFLEEVEKILENKEKILENTDIKIEKLVNDLQKNEEMIRDIIEER